MMASGKCLCGAVAFEATPLPTMSACHCHTCRKWGGGPFMAVPCKNTSFSGDITRYSVTDRAVRGFCPACGTHLFFYVKAADIYALPAGLFDDDPVPSLRAEYFIDQKPEYYCFAEQTKTLTGAEYFEKFS
ncbi:GFA family protein [Roseibium alexandrii]